jgi:hypothetical protein
MYKTAKVGGNFILMVECENCHFAQDEKSVMDTPDDGWLFIDEQIEFGGCYSRVTVKHYCSKLCYLRSQAISKLKLDNNK